MDGAQRPFVARDNSRSHTQLNNRNDVGKSIPLTAFLLEFRKRGEG